jgi:hypothetical protein
MLCHNRPGSGYSSFVWTEQIQEQNFRYAPTAALGLGVVTGGMRRLKADLDLASPEAAELLPKVNYEASRFRSDGKVFIDLVRKPDSQSCYYCHTNSSSDSPNGSRWLHDEDVHTRAGIQCADCHRNGLDHETVRGFLGQDHPSGSLSASFSCQGCHLGTGDDNQPGRLGAPRPLHQGLPPVHFEVMSCTSCHSGQIPSENIGRQINSIVHQLGSHIKRTGEELPAVHGDVLLPVDSSGRIAERGEGVYTPHRMMWPSFWGVISDGTIKPLNPELAYELVKRSLKVRKDFFEELAEVKLSLGQRKEILGDDRAARLKPEELSEEQRKRLAEAEDKLQQAQVNDRIVAALAEIEKANNGARAVLVSAGVGYGLGEGNQIATVDKQLLGSAADPYYWPSAHSVRPAQQSLGISGCTECHCQQSAIFHAQLQPVGVIPGQKVDSLAVHQLHGADLERLERWSQMFQGRSIFKIAGLIALGLTGVVLISAIAINLNDFWSRRR